MLLAELCVLPKAPTLMSSYSVPRNMTVFGDKGFKEVVKVKWGKEYEKALYCHSAYLIYMQSTSCEIPR